jgi:hypothetical protein
MDDLTVIFEEQRTHLRAVACRLLGSVHEADDAVQQIARVRAAVPLPIISGAQPGYPHIGYERSTSASGVAFQDPQWGSRAREGRACRCVCAVRR